MDDDPLKQKIRALRDLIAASSRIVVFTGAGISTESGISDYRSKGGLWQRFQPVTIQEFLADEAKRKEYWLRKKELFRQMTQAGPNRGHLALRRLEKTGRMLGIITQNIDGLHKAAGNANVIEIHGNNREIICLDCRRIIPFEPVLRRLEKGDAAPDCRECGGLLKPNTISFGQSLDPQTLDLSFSWARKCDLMIAAGSTLIVEPAASIPATAKHCGAKLAILNRDPTPLDTAADLVTHTDLGPFLEAAI